MTSNETDRLNLNLLPLEYCRDISDLLGGVSPPPLPPSPEMASFLLMPIIIFFN